MAKIGKFSRKYGLFLSNASNEEIVSVSKELMNGLSAEMKVTHNTSVALLATSMVTLIMMISLISGMSSTLIGTAKSIILLTKITAIAMVCISAVLSAKVIMSMSDASFVASILWRNVRETAALIYRKAVQKNLIRGRSIEGVVASSVYAACRQCGVPRTLDEVSDFSRIKRKEIGRTYRFMTRELKLKLLPTKPQDYIQRFCSELKLSGNTQNKAIEILKDATDKELTSGRGPTGVAAASIYIASILTNERRTQREVADVAGVTEVTIRNRYKELNEKLGMEITL